MIPASDVRAVATALGARLDATPLAMLLDVDGTLAPIAPRPADARVPAATRAVLERLAAAPGVHLALISGRGAEDATVIVGVNRVWAIGNHGMETRTPAGAIEADASARRFEGAVAQAARALEESIADVPGALVENKRWTLSLHYRLADEAKVPALIDRARSIAAGLQLRVTEGKKVVELRPPVSVDKGSAAVALASRLGALEGGATFFAGDDRTDEDAFRALREASSSAITVRVGPEGVETNAEFRLESPDDLRALLELIAERRAR